MGQPDAEELVLIEINRALDRVLPGNFPQQIRAGKNEEWLVNLRLTVEGDHAACWRLEVVPAGGEDPEFMPPGGITGTLLRSIAIRKAIDEAVGAYLRTPGPVGERARLSLPTPGSRRGRKGYGDPFYAIVGWIYLWALDEAPSRPVRWMTDLLRVYSYGTVRDWVAEARRRGFLTRGTKGRPGASPGPRAQEMVDLAMEFRAAFDEDKRVAKRQGKEEE